MHSHATKRVTGVGTRPRSRPQQRFIEFNVQRVIREYVAFYIVDPVNEKDRNMQSTLNFNPAENLMFKRQLDGGWMVLRKIPKPPGSTGGHFSVGYEVCDSSGRRAFLKAIDFSVA